MESVTHTTEKWEHTTDGEANFYGIATEKDWLMRVQQNGELSVEEQEANIRLIVGAPQTLKQRDLLLTLVEDILKWDGILPHSKVRIINTIEEAKPQPPTQKNLQ